MLWSFRSPFCYVSATYCVQTWALYLIHGITELEKVQYVVIMCLPGVRHLSNPERLDCIRTVSLQRRRLHRDHIKTINILWGVMIQLSSSYFVSQDIWESIPSCLRSRRNFSVVGVVNHWNKQSSKVVLALSLNCFTSRLDKAWNSLYPDAF